MTDLLEALRQYLPRQRWYSGADAPASLSVVGEELMWKGPPSMLDVLVDADGACYQALVGLRPAGERPDFLRGRDEAVMGEVDSDGGNRLLAYDAALDPELTLILLDIVTSSTESADHVRPVGGEQSNTSLVYDNRLILKIFRRLHPGPNLDAETTEALAEVGFTHVAAPVATLNREHGGQLFDLCVVQPFLAGGADGWALALTSLRDLFGVGDTQPVPIITDQMLAAPPPVDPGQAGGDFSAEARRLGTITAEMHAGLAQAFGSEPGDGRVWADLIDAQLANVSHPALPKDPAQRITTALRRAGDVGPSIRGHGDYHLGQVLRTDTGWYVLDFEGEPARPPDERRRPSSPLRDVAGMLRSLHYASAVASLDRDEDCHDLASAWEARNRRAFLDGYLRTATTGGLVPDPASTEIVLAAFELEKAVYELAYEQAYRPDWQSIPVAALHRLAAG